MRPLGAHSVRTVARVVTLALCVWVAMGYVLARFGFERPSSALIAFWGLLTLGLILGFMPALREGRKVRSWVQQRILGNAPLIEPRMWRESLARAERRICRVEQGGEPRGTAFLVGPNVVATCYHVLDDVIEGRVPKEAISFRFDCELSLSGTGAATAEAGICRKLDDTWCLFRSPPPQDHDYHSRSRDYVDLVLVRLVDEGEPLIDRGAFPFCETARNGGFGRGVLVLQHPRGSTLKLAQLWKENVELEPSNGLNIKYSVSTDAGSSGSPVLNGELELVGIHQASGPIGEQWNLGLRGDVLEEIVRTTLGEAPESSKRAQRGHS